MVYRLFIKAGLAGAQYQLPMAVQGIPRIPGYSPLLGQQQAAALQQRY